MAVIHQAHHRAARGRYHQAAIVFLVFALLAAWLVNWLVSARALPPLLLGDMRFPVTVAGVFVATALVWGAHRKFTVLLSLFVLYRAIVLAVAAATGRYLQVGPDPAVPAPDAWTNVDAVRAWLMAEVASATPGFEPSTLGRAAVVLPIVNVPANASLVAFTAAVLLLLATLMLWWAAARAVVGGSAGGGALILRRRAPARPDNGLARPRRLPYNSRRAGQ
jgi:hypothetical protein